MNFIFSIEFKINNGSIELQNGVQDQKKEEIRRNEQHEDLREYMGTSMLKKAQMGTYHCYKVLRTPRNIFIYS